MPAGVEQHQQRVALGAGEGQVRVAGQPARARRRRRSSSGAPLSCASGTCGDDPGDQPVAQRGEPRGALARRGRRRPTVATASPTIAATSRVPERTSRSWPPPCSSGVHSASRRSSSAPAPIGPPSLCPVIVSASTPLRAEVDRHLADRLHRVGVQRHADRRARPRPAPAMSLTVPISLLAHMTLATATSRAVAERLGQRLRGDPAGRLDRQPGDLGAVVLGQPLDAVQDGVVLGRADDDPAAAGVGLPAGPEQALDGEVVALGAAAGEQHLRRPGAQRLGEPLARLLGGAAGRAAARVQRGGVAHAAQLLGHRRQHLGQHRRGRRVVQVRHGAGQRSRGATGGPARRRRRSAGPRGHARTPTRASAVRRRRRAAPPAQGEQPAGRRGDQHADDADAQRRGGDVGDLEGRRVGAAPVLGRLVEQQHARRSACPAPCRARPPPRSGTPASRRRRGRRSAPSRPGRPRAAGSRRSSTHRAARRAAALQLRGRSPSRARPAVSGMPAAARLYPCTSVSVERQQRVHAEEGAGQQPARGDDGGQPPPAADGAARAAAAAGRPRARPRRRRRCRRRARSQPLPAYCSAAMPSAGQQRPPAAGRRGGRRRSGDGEPADGRQDERQPERDQRAAGRGTPAASSSVGGDQARRSAGRPAPAAPRRRRTRRTAAAAAPARTPARRRRRARPR